jgi:IclR family transcriptional regulator, pca regulon regulatory protein
MPVQPTLQSKTSQANGTHTAKRPAPLKAKPVAEVKPSLKPDLKPEPAIVAQQPAPIAVEADDLDDRAERDIIAGLAKGLSVIECFGEGQERLTIADVARVTGLSRAAARRCLLTLERLRYADFDGKYFRLSPRVLRLGHAYLSATGMPQVLQPFLERLSEATSECASATILDSRDIVYIARSATKRIMSVGLSVGTRLPATSTAMGRVLLAGLDPDEARRRIIASDRKKHTPRTITGVKELQDTVALARDRGYCIVDQELEVGLTSIAVPVISAAGATVAAINISVQSQRVSIAEMEKSLLPRLIETQRHMRPLIK